jgi:hypothetical protein
LQAPSGAFLFSAARKRRGRSRRCCALTGPFRRRCLQPVRRASAARCAIVWPSKQGIAAAPALPTTQVRTTTRRAGFILRWPRRAVSGDGHGTGIKVRGHLAAWVVGATLAAATWPAWAQFTPNESQVTPSQKVADPEFSQRERACHLAGFDRQDLGGVHRCRQRAVQPGAARSNDRRPGRHDLDRPDQGRQRPRVAQHRRHPIASSTPRSSSASRTPSTTRAWRWRPGTRSPGTG